MLFIWSILYNVAYWALVIICVFNTVFPVVMFLAMFIRQSRLFYSLFHKVDRASTSHGGELVAKILKSHGIDSIFTLPDGHVSSINDAAGGLSINVVNVRCEADAIFAADAIGRISGVPGVAVVPAGPGLTGATALVKNAQIAESPTIIIACAPSTLMENRGSPRDSDHMALMKSTTKKCFSVTTVRDIVPALREAVKISLTGVPGPVYVEFPADILLPYSVLAKQIDSMRPSKSTNGPVKKPSLKSRFIKTYYQFYLDNIFAGADHHWDMTPHPISIKYPKKDEINKTIDLLLIAKRPLLILGSQSTLRPFGPDDVAECIERLDAPFHLEGSARIMLRSSSIMQIGRAYEQTLKEADFVLVLGTVHESIVRSVSSGSCKIVCVNRSKSQVGTDSDLLCNLTQVIESDVGKFIVELTDTLDRQLPKIDDNNNPVGLLSQQIDRGWLEKLHQREHNKDGAIDRMSHENQDK